jgi:DNA invertase Pin-like site-specific DNA recombinase
MRARYTRISTPNQNMERQLAKEYANDQIFIDIVSGSVPFKLRQEGKILLQKIEIKEITYLSVKAIDRLGRNLYDITNTLRILENNNVCLKVDNLGLESIVNGKKNPTFNLIMSVMANVAQMERETLLERQKEGIAIAKIKGKYKGRVRGTSETKEEILIKYKGVVKLLNQGYSIRKVAKLESASVGTVLKVKKLIDL